MKKLIVRVCAALLLAGAVPVVAQQNPALPVIEHDGQNCYFYTVKSNESVFGILARFGWDEQTFMRYNPKAANLKKGQVVYYPLEVQAAPSVALQPRQEPKPETAPQPVAEPASQPVAEASAEASAPVSAAEPESAPKPAAAEPVAEMTVSRPLPPAGVPMVYTVKEGDTLYSLAREYFTTITNLFRDNAGLSADDLKAGQQIRITPGRPGFNVESREVTEKRMVGKRSYKVSEGDTWESIAAAEGVSKDLLLAVNSTNELPKAGKKIQIPLVADTVIIRQAEVIDPLETTPEGRQQLYRNVHGIPSDGRLDMTVIIGDTPESKTRDTEFVRGMLLALDRMKSTRPKVSLHVRRYNAAQLPQALLTDPVMAGSQVIISTADRDFPAGLAEYASRNGKTAINVFDAKSDLYTQPGVMQLLPPSADFYASCADYLLADKGNSKYIFLAEDDADGETLSLILLERLIREGKRYETLPAYDDLVNYSYAPADSYVIVSDLSKRADLNKLATIMEKVIAANPAATFSVVGRPTWVLYGDGLKSKFQKMDTYIPSRFFVDEDAADFKAFKQAYDALYKEDPVKSLPGFAAMGYDLGCYLAGQMEGNADINRLGDFMNAVQLDIKPERAKAWTGILNGNVYLIRYTPYNTIDRIRL